MQKKTRQILLAPYTQELPGAIYFRSAPMPADGFYPPHHHPWGEFVSAVSGVVEVQYAGGHYVVPPQYGIWLPPHTEHLAQNRREAWHSSVYISVAECADLPTQVTALTVSPLLRAMLEHLHRQPPGIPPSAAEARFLKVLVDLLATAERAGSYLPSSDDPLVQKVLNMLQHEPGDSRSVAELAAHVHTSERTLMRRCQRDLGMTLAEWRQRLRVVKAMSLLAQGRTVESIALELGYASSSAFITMFRRLTQETPDEYRKRTVGLER
ncbi:MULTISPECIES: helix-turn-helix domain-containing protein [unclassified Janthinobacterium]|uniref:AraC family transcriptional regulator n=1 Tax=unclassified Janthinobacterium TaxID=2610881 RepID=UPI00161A7C86|nr:MULTISPECIES: helix-turn-helix transcriptional regulator [unclassified Janthinobacterium]MBB5369308.1 AraC-like DNA-binding protein [Janthinobacterium sp. K2C7]MBB5381156.1 AraC-like DNA-binding protein [Janthinobacterium sp. K2Li3]MBB5387691.1 AraC-like DNA-binding protein [Janthinobacterium sp. K2E3]